MTAADVAAWLTAPRGRALQWPVIIVAIVVAFGLGIALGVARAPERVEVRTEYLATKHRTETKAKARDVQRFKKTTTLPNGTKIEESSERIALKVDTAIKEDQRVADVRSSITTSRPDWRVGVLLGASLQVSPSLQLQPAVGLQGERRILGPFSLGAWGIVEIPPAGGPLRGIVGASVSGEF